MAKSASNEPANELRFGAVKVVIWQNETKHGPMYNSNVCRLYRNADGDWQQTDSLGHSDLLSAAFALQEAYRWIAQEQNAERRAERRRREAPASSA